MRTLACRAYWTALEGRPGAVHLNFPLREPLVGEEPLPEDHSGRPHGRPYVARAPLAAGRLSPASEERRTASRPRPREGAEAILDELVRGARRGVVVAGRDERVAPPGIRSVAEQAAAFAAGAGWPLLADPLSGARRGEAAIAHYDALLREQGFAAVT